MENDCTICSDELRKNIEEKVGKELDQQIITLIDNDNHALIEDIVAQIDLKTIENEIYDKLTNRIRKKSWTNYGICDNLENVINGLINSKTTNARLKILDELLNVQIIDTGQRYWDELSKNLIQLFLNTHNEIFLRTLKIHHKIIAFPNSSCDGYLSLLQGAYLMLENRFFEKPYKIRVFHVIKMLLETFNYVWHFLVRTSNKLHNDIVQGFLKIITYQSKLPKLTVSVFDYIAILDSKANWLALFCTKAQTRLTVFEHFKNDFLKIIFNNFLNEGFTDISHHHSVFSSYFLMHFLSYEENISIFPYVLGTQKITCNYLLEQFLSKIRHKENDELQKIFINIFKNNPTLLNENLLTVLLEHFKEIERHDMKDVIKTNLYIVNIIRNLLGTHRSNILFNSSNKFYRARHRNSFNRTAVQLMKNLNFPQRFVDLSINLMRNYINLSESNRLIDKEIIVILDLCGDIYDSHSIALHCLNTNKFITTLKDFYLTSNNFVVNHPHKIVITKIFHTFLTNYHLTVEILNDDHALDEILNDIILLYPNKQLGSLINHAIENRIGYEIVRSNYNKIIKSPLENIWYYDEIGESESAINEFIYFLFVIKSEQKSVKAFLFNDNEGTIVENDSKTCNLAELLEKCLDTADDGTEEYLGLLILKILITNVDLALTLQVQYKISEKLASIQEHYTSGDDENSTAIIIDNCSSLRNNILISLDNLGFVSGKWDKNLLDQTNFPTGNPRDSSAVKNKHKPLNELQKFLNGVKSGLHDYGWILQAKRAFKVICFESYNSAVLVELIEQIPKTYVYRKNEFIWPAPDSVYYQMYPEDFIGITTIINYGLKKELFSNNHEENLILLIKQSRALIGHQPEDFNNFDWFVGVIYLICSGNYDKCKSVLLNTIYTPITSLIWFTFGLKYDKNLQDNFYRHLPVILEEENPACFQALKLCPGSLVKSWLSQCFFNIFEFEEICNFIGFSILYPTDCLIYFMVAIFMHLTERICTATHSTTFENILKINDLSDFKLHNYLNFIEKLMKQYKNVIKL